MTPGHADQAVAVEMEMEATTVGDSHSGFAR